MDGGKEVLDSLLGNFADFESAVAFRGECVCIESNERVSRAMLFERVVKCEKAREVSRVCDEGRPYFFGIRGGYILLGYRPYLSLRPRL